jgi:hypothetical protein
MKQGRDRVHFNFGTAKCDWVIATLCCWVLRGGVLPRAPQPGLTCLDRLFVLRAPRRLMRRAPVFVRARVSWTLALLISFLVVCSQDGRAQQAGFDRENYYRAVRYCRQNTLIGLGPLTISPDRRVLCFDGPISTNMDIPLAKNLESGGLFVVRSSGGQAGPAIALSDVIRSRQAVVVTYDYCFSACAQFFLIAPDQAFVLKGALVAWHNPQSGNGPHPLCPYLVESRDGKGKRLRHGVCGGDGRESLSDLPILRQFFKERIIDPSFEAPPDSLYVRRRLMNLYAETGLDRDIAWTLHPRYYPGLFKTKITYEAYPESQDEVDEILARIGLWNVKVIYDP